MADEFIVPPGTRIVIEIDEETGEAGARADEAEAQASTPVSGLLPGALSEERLFRRPDAPVITFYDLGTRLRSLPGDPGAEDLSRARALTDTETPEEVEGGFNEYVEINADGITSNFASIDTNNDANSGTRGFQAEIAEADYLALDAACLGALREGAADTLDPLGTTKANGSGRRLPNCMQLSHKLWAGQRSGSIPIDLVLHREGRTERLPLAEVDRPSVRLIGRPYNGGQPIPNLDAKRWKKRKPKAEKDALEKWNAANIAEGVAFEAGYLDASGLGGIWDLEVDNRLYYEKFDTGNRIGYKVTREARFDAEEVDFKLAGGKSARVFLKPQWLVMCPHRVWTTNAYLIGYETYYFDYTPANLPYRSRVGVQIIQRSQIPAEPREYYGYIVSGLVSKFNPALRPGVYTVTGVFDNCQATLTLTGQASGVLVVPGTPIDSGGRCHISGGGEITPGLFVHGGDVLLYPDFPLTASATGETYWNGDGQTFSLGYVLTTATIGRVPVYGRLFNSGWNSVFDYMGGNSSNPISQARGLLYKDNTGLQLGFNSGGSPPAVYTGGREAFKRRPGWNAQEVAKEKTGRQTFRPLSYYAQDEAKGLQCEVGTGITDAPALIAFPFGEVAQFLTEGRGRADALRTCLAAMPWHRNFLTTYADGGAYSSFGGADYTRSLDIIPSRRLPAGRLCGIIEQGGRVYYVWGRTNITQSLPDYDREQVSGLI